MSSSKKKATSKPASSPPAPSPDSEADRVVGQGSDGELDQSLTTPQINPPDGEDLGRSAEEDSGTASTLLQQPIPPPSEPLQFRAIGLLQGIYQPSEDQFNRGELMTREGLHLDAVLLGQVMSLVKKYLDLALPHVWVVYPRTRDHEAMHVQIVGVWSPSGFETPDRDDASEEAVEEVVQASLDPLEQLQPPLQDGFFSIRGQVIQQSVDDHWLAVKIQQTSRSKPKTPKVFKVKLMGDIPQKPMGYFWDFEVLRDGEHLRIQKATPVAFMPMKKKKKSFKKRAPLDGEGKPGRPVQREADPRSARPGSVPKNAGGDKPVDKKPSVPSRPLPKYIQPHSSED
ncbi:hypothetical protein [Lyngbya confervoides]|uniref:Uncharacterized protein n=1 Tax=Lyngbya confervoides BDU141951 TaxID=1574623 RepID=A0ABD4T0D4_9CYAN|nr:hypothetical protein [Lyngbya confervoides]MCM1982111.1 hypothetical protein [Lyngbya confervoides BDU141951]